LRVLGSYARRGDRGAVRQGEGVRAVRSWRLIGDVPGCLGGRGRGPVLGGVAHLLQGGQLSRGSRGCSRRPGPTGPRLRRGRPSARPRWRLPGRRAALRPTGRAVRPAACPGRCPSRRRRGRSSCCRSSRLFLSSHFPALFPDPTGHRRPRAHYMAGVMTCGEHDATGHSGASGPSPRGMRSACHDPCVAPAWRAVVVITGFPVFSLGVPRHVHQGNCQGLPRRCPFRSQPECRKEID